ncbi:hypothetical protein ACU19_09650 [Actinobaculum suis]|nr:hypothetical protein ACU19_09650 [Actinobaculum suis]
MPKPEPHLNRNRPQTGTLVAMAQVPISAIHPAPQDRLTMEALFSAPIDVLAALQRLADSDGRPLQIGISAATAEGEMREIAPEEAASATGPLIYHYQAEGTTVLLTPLSRPLPAGETRLPEHSFHIKITMLTPAGRARAGQQAAATLSDTAMLEGRAAMRNLFRAYTPLARSLMNEAAAVGIVRRELGIAYPAHEIANFDPESPTPYLLWIYIPVVSGDLRYGRTVGLPLFGHLDLQVSQSVQSAEAVYELLVNIAGYIIDDGATLMPGQTVEAPGTGQLEISQAQAVGGEEEVLALKY